jgi:hypothetical protein
MIRKPTPFVTLNAPQRTLVVGAQARSQFLGTVEPLQGGGYSAS